MLNVNNLESLFKETNARTYLRGFVPFFVDVLNAQQSVSPITSILELGIGAGLKHAAWHDASDANTTIGGIDHFDYRKTSMRNMGNFEHWKNCQINSENLFSTRERIKVLYDKAYIESSVIKIKELMDVTSIDVIVDDSCAGPFEKVKPSLATWKNSISLKGCYISETPDGNGTPLWRSETIEEHFEHFRILREEQDMIVFDFSPIRIDFCLDYSSNFLGFYAPDMSIYQSVIDKYKQYIIN